MGGEGKVILQNTDIKKFNDLVKGRDIICFGSGRYLDFFFYNCPLASQIKCIVDNNSYKWNTFRKVENFERQILSPVQLPELLTEDSVILITAGVIGVEIVHQLENMNLPKDQQVFWAAFVFNELESLRYLFRRELPDSLRINQEPLIPKIIHYCWVGGNSIPEEHQKYIEGWRNLCPDYEIICWNEKNYNIEKNPYMKKAYEEKKWGFVSDYMRKDIVYQYGGIYLDTDVEMIKRPDELLYQDGFCGIELAADRTFKINTGLGFGARKELAILKEMCDIYNGEDFQFRERKFMKIGPDYETEVLEQHGLRIDEGYQILDGMTVYPMEVLSGTTMLEQGENQLILTIRFFTTGLSIITKIKMSPSLLHRIVHLS